MSLCNFLLSDDLCNLMFSTSTGIAYVLDFVFIRETLLAQILDSVIIGVVHPHTMIKKRVNLNNVNHSINMRAP